MGKSKNYHLQSTPNLFMIVFRDSLSSQQPRLPKFNLGTASPTAGQGVQTVRPYRPGHGGQCTAKVMASPFLSSKSQLT